MPDTRCPIPEVRSQKLEVRSQMLRDRCYRKSLLLVFCLLSSVFCLLSTSVAYARHTSSKELIENPRFYDGKKVTYQGEVVGDVMIRGKNAWIHVNDDRYSILASNKGERLVGYNKGQGIWLTASEARKITYVGGYKQSGDIVRIEGIFNQACPEHGGVMDIHAEKLAVVRHGAPFEYPLDFAKVIAVGILALLSGSLYLLYRAVQKRRLQRSAA